MPSASRTITISAAIDDVFSFFTNPANDTAWRPGVKDIHAHGAPEVGAIIHQVVSGPLRRGISADIEITEFAAPTRYAFATVSGPVRPTGSFTFTATADGTSVTFELAAATSWLKARLMDRAVQKSMDAAMAGLDRAKAVIEDR